MGFAMPEYEIATEKSADKMFEELGYEVKESNRRIEYYYDLPFWQPSITFDKKSKEIKSTTTISIIELKAINKKCEELGWL